MNFADFRDMLKRAAFYSLDKTKLLFTASVLFFAGLVMIFGMSLACSFGPWVAQSLSVTSLFVAIGILMASGVVLIRSYHDEVKGKEVEIITLFLRSWPTLLQALSLFVPLVLGYLALWIANGLFLLIANIPFLGQLLATIFIVIPFLLNVATLLLILASIYLVFALTPTFALGTLWQEGKFTEIMKDAFQHTIERISLFCVAIVPFFVTLLIGACASYCTLELLVETRSTLDLVMKWFFMMLPFAMLLSPPVVFLFNMATEAHILIRKRYS